MRTQTRRVVALATAIPVLALSLGTGGKTVRAAPSNKTAPALQLAEAPPGLASQQAYEIWLNTLADTVDRGAYKKELAEWKRLHTETIGDYAAYMSSGALYTTVSADTAAKKAEAGILEDLRVWTSVTRTEYLTAWLVFFAGIPPIYRRIIVRRYFPQHPHYPSF